MQSTEISRFFSLGVRSATTRAIAAAVFALGLSACGEGDSTVATGDKSYSFQITEKDLVIGDPDAPITIVEYSSMTCPHCAHFHETVFPTLKEKYIDKGHAKLVFRHFPLDGIAAQASLLIACTSKERQVKLIEALFARQEVWIQDDDGPMNGLTKMARQANFTDEAISQCARNKENMETLQNVVNDGQTVYDVTGTPKIFVNGAAVRMTTVADLDRIMANLVPNETAATEDAAE